MLEINNGKTYELLWLSETGIILYLFQYFVLNYSMNNKLQ